jgi:hypothetical protein
MSRIFSSASSTGEKPPQRRNRDADAFAGKAIGIPNDSECWKTCSGGLGLLRPATFLDGPNFDQLEFARGAFAGQRKLIFTPVSSCRA